MFPRSASDEVGRGRVEEDLSDLARRRADAENRVKVLWNPAFLAPSFKCGGLDFPDEEVTIFAA